MLRTWTPFQGYGAMVMAIRRHRQLPGKVVSCMNGSFTPNERDIEVNGITLRVVTWGEMSDPARAVLLVHGITANSRTWVRLGPLLAARGWFPIAIDLRGRGRSGSRSARRCIRSHARC